jgi:dTDP-4-amino-4,6-dideoxygalactose transaminase
MDPNALEEAFKKYPDFYAVRAAHLYGLEADMDRIMEFATGITVSVISN